MAQSLDSLAGKMRSTVNALKANRDAVLTELTTRTQATILLRIFNDGQAADETPIGDYSPTYVLIRQQAGRQVAYVDLEFTGELRESIKAGLRNGTHTIEIVGEESRRKMADNERRFNKQVFAIGPREEAEIQIGIEKIVRDFLAGWFG